jgi:micrococcal nuclease
VAIVGLLAGERAFRGPSGGSDFARYHDKRFHVAKIVDGDTLDLAVPDGDHLVTRVRLWGVDTPEIGGDNGPAHFGPEARDFARRTLLGREVHVVLTAEDTRDKYGRLLAFLQLDRGGIMFNELLIEQGFAYADPRFDHPYKERFTALEKRARREGLGLWAQLNPADMPAWRQRFEQRLTRSDPPPPPQPP